MKNVLFIGDQTVFDNRPKLPPEIKEKWITALRSGEYKQGKLRLATPNNYFCCLGVLCEILEIPKVIKELRVEYDGNNTSLPASVKDLTNLNDVGYFKGFMIGKHCSLAGMNDKGESFETISNIIETYF